MKYVVYKKNKTRSDSFVDENEKKRYRVIMQVKKNKTTKRHMEVRLGTLLEEGHLKNRHEFLEHLRPGSVYFMLKPQCKCI